MTEERMREKVKSFIFKEYGTQRKAAKAWGMQESRLSEILKGKFHVPDNILADLGYKAERKVTITYSKIKKEEV
jgi:hypothetical protein